MAAWDAMSLALCLGWDDYEVDHVGVTLSQRTTGGSAPRPGRSPPTTLLVHCEGRRLTGNVALEDAPRERLEFSLAP